MGVHSFHNKLKTNYLKGKVNRRVDVLLHVLFRIEEDNFFSYRKKCQNPAASSRSEGTRHQNAMGISAERVEVKYHALSKKFIIHDTIDY